MSDVTSVDVRMKSLLVLFLLAGTLLGLARCQDLRVAGDCEMTDVADAQWGSKIVLNISDTDRGEIFRRSVTNVLRISRVEYSNCDVKIPPYLNTSIQQNDFVITLLENRFPLYEFNETSTKMSVFFTFECARGIRSLMLSLNIRDTNNHAPEFLPTNDIQIPIRLPLSNGYPVSTIFGEIKVRDVDLTNYAIIPTIQPNDFFDVKFKEANYALKQYTLILVTKQEIRTFDSPLTLFITAQDVDTTEYPSLTTIGLITISPNGTNVAPEAPEFEFPIYTGMYNNEFNFVQLQRNISIVRGWDPRVTLSLEGAGAQYFIVRGEENMVTIFASGVPIPDSVIYSSDPFVLTLTASRSTEIFGSTAIIINFVKEPNCRLSDLNDTIWTEGLMVNISDTMFGDSARIPTINIESIISYNDEPGTLNNGPYYEPVLYGNRVDFEFNSKFGSSYERNETRNSFKTYIKFKCARGERTLPVIHNIADSNTFDPEFLSKKEYEIFTPIPRNFSISYYGAVVFRDYDLTTYAINATLSTNRDFRLEPQPRQPNSKEFRFSLISNREILSINGNLTLEITGEDIDLTGDPRRSVTETIVIRSTPTSLEDIE